MLLSHLKWFSGIIAIVTMIPTLHANHQEVFLGPKARTMATISNPNTNNPLEVDITDFSPACKKLLMSQSSFVKNCNLPINKKDKIKLASSLSTFCYSCNEDQFKEMRNFEKACADDRIKHKETMYKISIDSIIDSMQVIRATKPALCLKDPLKPSRNCLVRFMKYYNVSREIKVSQHIQKLGQVKNFYQFMAYFTPALFVEVVYSSGGMDDLCGPCGRNMLEQLVLSFQQRKYLDNNSFKMRMEDNLGKVLDIYEQKCGPMPHLRDSSSPTLLGLGAKVGHASIAFDDIFGPSSTSQMSSQF